ncbi:ABC transporter permease [Cellulomonas carbonis]|uniref:ABC transporter permease n=1 Tax=Cellulomonas carbonis TaxID=1386092 RepID=UPI0006934BA6|nr:ABC transporter permease [Cellulomonas carbonis]GGB92103.1 hypothetical protein GCM10010972_00960 [Cellulomonas carbonis]
MSGGALLARQVRHELVALVRSPVTLILSVGFPLLFFVLIAALVGDVEVAGSGGVRVAQLVAPGFAAFGVVMATFSFLAYGFSEARATGVLKRLGGTPLPRWALLGGRIGAALLLGLIATALVVGVGVAAFGIEVQTRSVAAVLVTIVLGSVTFSALGLALATVLPTPQTTLAVTNGLVVVLSFFSGVFTFGAQTPAWMSTVGSLFPLEHLVVVLGDAFDPFLTGSGFQPDRLAALATWGVAGALLGAWGLRRTADGATRTTRATRATRGGRAAGVRGRDPRAADARPRRTTRPTVGRLVLDEVGHTQRALWRDPSSTFFAVAFPVVLAVVIPLVNGGGDVELEDGALLGTWFAATMAVYGAAVTAYVNMPESLAEARARGVLKRLRGTPLPLGALLAGRVAGAVAIALWTTALVLGVSAVVFGTGVPPGWSAAAGVVTLSAVCFATLGLAVVALVRSGESVVGVTLGSLLPLCFVSDVFVRGATFPPWLDALSWVFPLRHAANATTTAVVGDAVPAEHLLVIAAWTVAGAAVVAWRFERAEAARRHGPVGPRRPAPSRARRRHRVVV